MERTVLFTKAVLLLAVVGVFAGVAVGASETVSGAADTFTVKLQIDKPYCLLNFMETLRTRGYYGPMLYEYYQKSKYSDDENLAKLVQQYSSVRFTYPYHFDGYPKYRFMAKGRVTSDVFFTLSARTDSLEDFKQMTVGIIPFDDHRRLFEILEAAEPIYDELIWKPYYGIAKERLKGLREYAEKVKMGEMPGLIANFLNSNWATDIPLIVSFSIVPGEKIKRVPPPIGNVIRAGLLTESDDYSWYIGLIVHEFSHRAFAEQPLAMHQQIDQWFESSKSPHRGMVNFMFNEVLGGAVGHKVREDLLGPHEFTYDQPAIKAFDEAIYPLVTSYLDEGKSIDQAFVNESLRIYGETFPNALREYSSLFQAYYLLTDLEENEAQKLPGPIMKNICSPMMYEVKTPIIDDQNINALIAYDFTKVIVITKDHDRTIEYLKGKISELNRFKNLNTASDFALSCHDVDGNPYVIINLQSLETFEEVLKKLKAEKMIDSNNPVVPL